jgi:hypothetical protein
MENDLKKPKEVKFDHLYLDPNNPRIAPESPPGYDDPDRIFESVLQEELVKKVQEVYNVADLEASIVAHGWVPIDAILVWEHPDATDHYIVVEGNTRTVALKNIRERLEREKAKLDRIERSKSGYAEEHKEEQRQLVSRLQQIVDDTKEVQVFPVNASDSLALEEKLPRLLGVRHISHAQQWTPYALNLYILSLYRQVYQTKYGPDEPLRIEAELAKQVGDKVSLGETKTRRNIQAANAFSHFKLRYIDRLPDGEGFTDSDQYFFEQILQNKYPQDQFGFGDDLKLSDEMEEVLFQWVFSKPRNGDDNENILRKAEDIRLWARVKRYDDEKGTSYHTLIDVEQPEKARRMAEIEADYLTHKARISPLDNLAALIDALKEVKADAILYQASHLKPMIDEIVMVATKYKKMIEATAEEEIGS